MADDDLQGTGPGSEPARNREIGKEWPAWLMLAALWGLSLWGMGRLPGRVPMHWSFAGEVDGWGTPLQASLLLPAI